MSAIAGYLDFGADLEAEVACATMLAALRAFGGDASDCKSQGPATFGRVLKQVLPEDQFDQQPWVSPGRRRLLVAEGRIDNRDELAEALQIDRARLAATSDSWLLLAAWEKWNRELFERVLGDLAFAVWDGEEHSLTLGRSPLSTRSLFYHRHSRFVAFASTPQALCELPLVPREPNLDAVPVILSGRMHFGAPATMFRHIYAVESGKAVHFAGGCPQTFRLWEPRRIGVPRDLATYSEGLRFELDRAVSSQLRRAGGSVACQLSGGRDSSAVATSAAAVLRTAGEQLIAVTGAPGTGFQDIVPPMILVDESRLAATTAAAHPNIRHFVHRPGPVDVQSLFDSLHHFHFGPMLTPSNVPWWSGICELAAGHGASVMLNGAAGNFSISSGGQNYVLELLREGSLRAFLGAVRRIGGNSIVGWRNVATLTIGALLPPGVYSTFRALAGREPKRFFDVAVLRQPWRVKAEEIRREGFNDPRPAADFRKVIADILVRIDNSDRVTSGCWGLDIRDPTSDRRLVDYCHSMPATGLFSGRSDRPAYEAAFGDRIPPAVLHNRLRARQQGDWYEVFRPDDVRHAFRHYARNPLVSELFDIAAIEAMIDRWPTGPEWMADPKRMRSLGDDYRNKLLGSLSIASFLDVHFPDRTAG